MNYQKTKGYRLFSVCNNVGVGLLGFACVAPLIHVLAVSLSSSAPANSNLVGFWPVGFNTRAYQITIQNQLFWHSFFVSVLRVICGTCLGLLITLLAAYPLSKEEADFRGRTMYVWLFVFTMLFGGGLIPSYIVIKNLGLIDSFWVMVMPGLVSVGNIILMLNFFRSIPKALSEAAYIDGAGHIMTLFKVYIPISLPSFATIALFLIVGHWNAWFDGMIYLSKPKLQPMATYLRQFLQAIDVTEMKRNEEDMRELSDRAVRFAQIFISMIPIVAIYPFLQRFFIVGIKVGSVKE